VLYSRASPGVRRALTGRCQDAAGRSRGAARDGPGASPRVKVKGGGQRVQVLLIRHASNDWLGRRLPGWTPGIHLNEQGRGEAALLASRLVDHPLEAVYSSPLERAMETAAFVAGPHGLAAGVVEALGEVRCGEWEGRELEALRADPLWELIRTRPSVTAFPGGENAVEVQDRAVAAIEDLRSRHSRSVAAVSHADVIEAVLAHYVGLEIDLFRSLQVWPASLSVLRFDERGARLVLFNDTGKVPLEPEPDRPVPVADGSAAGVAGTTGATGVGGTSGATGVAGMTGPASAGHA